MKSIAITIVAVGLITGTGCSASLDQSSPEGVVNAVFHAAKSGDATHLSQLCDPRGDNDGDTRRICKLTNDGEDWKRFVEYFADGSVGTDVRTAGSRAVVPFKFGPGGTKSEEMKVIEVDGKWYLSSF